jgi:hypothetical protein
MKILFSLLICVQLFAKITLPENGVVALINFSQAIKKECLTAEHTEVTEARNAQFSFFSRCARW